MAKYFVKAMLEQFDEEGMAGYSEGFQEIIDIDSEDIENMDTFAKTIRGIAGVDNSYSVDIISLVKLEV